MVSLDIMKELSKTTESRIVMLVIDGLGGLPHPETGKTELETAHIPNLDLLASKAICGLSEPVSPGITPGSAPGHLALFGYDPVAFGIGRGVLEALGIDFDLEPGDIAARGNFCTIDKDGMITDRRAGRISTEQSSRLCQLLDGMEIGWLKIIVRPVKEHRFVVIFRYSEMGRVALRELRDRAAADHGPALDIPDSIMHIMLHGLHGSVSDSDPQQIGVAARDITDLDMMSRYMADIANKFVAKAKVVLAGYYPANMILLRGFSKKPQFPTMTEVYKLKPAAIASYPMYRGLAKVVGMEVLKTGTTIEDEFETLKQSFSRHDFFFIHIKPTDAAGEDGDFDRKVALLEQIDKALISLMNLAPDVIVVSGDHSTPAVLKGHSWHPVPVLLYSRWCRPDRVNQFSESDCIHGGLGRIPATEIMPLAMANALKLNKFGA